MVFLFQSCKHKVGWTLREALHCIIRSVISWLPRNLKFSDQHIVNVFLFCWGKAMGRERIARNPARWRLKYDIETCAFPRFSFFTMVDFAVFPVPKTARCTRNSWQLILNCNEFERSGRWISGLRILGPVTNYRDWVVFDCSTFYSELFVAS
jgi:hypothetical protein